MLFRSVVNSASGWSSWGALSAFPSLGGLKPSHGLVGITSILDGAGEARILMAVIAANENGSNVYVSPILIPAGNKWKSTPAIVAVGPVTTSRTDYFAYASNTSDSNGAIYYRWKFNGSWKNSSWTQIPQPPNGVTIKSSPSAALHGTTLYLAARGSDGAMWFNTLPNVTDSGTYGGPWTGWASLGGVLTLADGTVGGECGKSAEDASYGRCSTSTSQLPELSRITASTPSGLRSGSPAPSAAATSPTSTTISSSDRQRWRECGSRMPTGSRSRAST